MELSLLLLEKIGVMLIMVAMGFISVKRGKLKSTDSTVLSRLTFDWIIPCSLIAAFQRDYEPEKMQAFLFACGASIFSILLYIVITRLIHKPLKLNPAEQGSMIFSNSAGLGAPLVAAVLGSDEIFFSAAHMGLQNISIFFVLPLLMSRDAKVSWKKLFLNKNTVSITIGLVLFLTQTRLPGFVGTAVSTVGGLLSPVSMFMIGMIMGGVKLGELLREKRIYLVAAARLLIYPMIFILIIKFSGIINMLSYARDVLLVVLIGSCASVATLVTQFATEYRGQKEAADAGSINVLCTILCVFTMPLLVLIYQVLC